MIKVKVPQDSSQYVLELDIVQEQLNIFHERGSQSAK